MGIALDLLILTSREFRERPLLEMDNLFPLYAASNFHHGRIVVLTGREKGATQIAAASYDPATEQVTLRTRVGGQWTIKVGAALVIASP
jgi:hypothetical protein